MSKEVQSRLERIRENKEERLKAMKELDELFPEAGFLLEREKVKGVIKVDGEWISVY
jgi:hypothetical protein